MRLEDFSLSSPRTQIAAESFHGMFAFSKIDLMRACFRISQPNLSATVGDVNKVVASTPLVFSAFAAGFWT